MLACLHSPLRRTVALKVDEVLTPGTVRLVPGEGMPHSKHPGQRGDLLVHCEVGFPRRLSEEQRQAIRRALPAQ